VGVGGHALLSHRGEETHAFAVVSVITRDEWPGTRAEFDRLDRNHNRELNRDEFSRR
jgi:hypothetical protein